MPPATSPCRHMRHASAGIPAPTPPVGRQPLADTGAEGARNSKCHPTFARLHGCNGSSPATKPPCRPNSASRARPQRQGIAALRRDMPPATSPCRHLRHAAADIPAPTPPVGRQPLADTGAEGARELEMPPKIRPHRCPQWIATRDEASMPTEPGAPARAQSGEGLPHYGAIPVIGCHGKRAFGCRLCRALPVLSRQAMPAGRGDDVYRQSP
jgi:hypothetical protein